MGKVDVRWERERYMVGVESQRTGVEKVVGGDGKGTAQDAVKAEGRGSDR